MSRQAAPKGACSTPGCDRLTFSRGMCGRCYQRDYRTKRPARSVKSSMARAAQVMIPCPKCHKERWLSGQKAYRAQRSGRPCNGCAEKRAAAIPHATKKVDGATYVEAPCSRCKAVRDVKISDYTSGLRTLCQDCSRSRLKPMMYKEAIELRKEELQERESAR